MFFSISHGIYYGKHLSLLCLSINSLLVFHILLRLPWCTYTMGQQHMGGLDGGGTFGFCSSITNCSKKKFLHMIGHLWNILFIKNEEKLKGGVPRGVFFVDYKCPSFLGLVPHFPSFWMKMSLILEKVTWHLC